MRARDPMGDSAYIRADSPATRGSVEAGANLHLRSVPLPRGRGLLALQRSVGNAAISASLKNLITAADEASAAVDQVEPVAAPADVRPGAQGLVQTVLDGERRGRKQLAGAVGAAAGEIVQEATGHASSITVAGGAAAGQVEQHVATAHGRLSDSTAAARARVGAEQGTASGQLNAWQARANSGVTTTYDRGIQQIEAKADEQSAATTATAAQAAAAVNTRTEQAAGAAAPPADGSGERGQGRAAVTSKVAAPATATIRQQGQAAAKELVRGGTSAGAEVRNVGQRARTALTAHRGEDVSGVATAAATATAQVEHVTTMGKAAVDAAYGEAARDLGRAGGQAADSLSAGASQQAAQVAEAGTEAARALATRATEVTTEARSGVQQQLAALGPADLPADGAAAAQTELGGGIDALYAESGAAATAHAAATRTSLGTAAGQATAALSGHASAVRDELDAGTSRHEDRSTATAAQAGSAIGQLSGQAQTAGDAAVGRVVAGVDAGAAQATAGVGQAAQQATSELEAHQASTTRAVDQGGSDARAKVAEGQSRFDQAYAQRQQAEAPTQRLVVQRDVWGWLKGQWGDFLAMVKNPAFLVGLGVTLLLLPLGPIALVLGGMAGGIVAGIQKNQAEGKPWHDFHNLMVGGLEGALVGTIFAVATLALIYFNVGLLAGALVIGTLSAAVGIVANLIHGQPWDRGLLANFFLAALLHLIGGAFKAKGGPVVRPGGGAADPAAPAGPRGPVVEPRPVDPNAPPEAAGPARPRACFVPGTPVLTADGPRAIEVITVGTRVWTIDPAGVRTGPHPVVAVSTTVVPLVLDVVVDQTVVSVSPEHPFWVVDQGWTVAGRLEPGSVLLRADGSPATVHHIGRRLTGEHRVHNLTVDGSHTYLVSELQLLVHNKGDAYDVGKTLESLSERTQAAHRAAESQPAETPNRAEQIGQLRALRARISELQREMNDSDPDLPGIEADAAKVDGQLAPLEDALPDTPSAPEPAPAQALTSEGAFEALQRRTLWQRINDRLPGRRWSARLAEEMRSDNPAQAKRKLLVTGTKSGSPPETIEISVVYDRTTGTFADMHESSGASPRQ